jgi:hypothetical protein
MKTDVYIFVSKCIGPPKLISFVIIWKSILFIYSVHLSQLSPETGNVHWLSLDKKVNAPVRPEGGEGEGVSNDSCIIDRYF